MCVRILLILLVACVLTAEARAQSPTSSDGTDFYVGYFSDPQHPVPIYALVGAYVADTISFYTFDQQGRELLRDRIVLAPLSTTQRSLDATALLGTPDGRVGYGSYHITATTPISLQIYSDHNNGCELYLALPTNLLGSEYRTTNYANRAPMPNDSLLRPVVEVIAVLDSTMVYISPACPTRSPVPDSVMMMRGQVYRLSSHDPFDQDLTGTMVRSSFPVAVLNGHEGAQLPALSGINHYTDKLDNVENILIEQSRPTEYWTPTGYPALPFDTTTIRYAVYANFPGSKFRTLPAWDAAAFGSQASNELVSARGMSAKPLTSGAWQEFDSVQPAVIAQCDSAIPIDCIQYDYYRGSMTSEGITRGFSAPTMMNIIPISWWKTEYLWHVPASSQFHSGQYIGIIYYDKSPPTILHNGANVPWQISHSLVYPTNPQLRCASIRVAPGTYWATAAEPFIVYSYGRSENNYKITSAYAAPCGMMGIDWNVSHSNLKFDSSCSGWTGTLVRSGVAQLLIRELKVFDQSQATKLHVKATTNMTLASLQVDDTTWACTLRPIDPLKNGTLYLYLRTNVGLEFVRVFTYLAPGYTLPKIVKLSRILIGRDTCVDVGFVNRSVRDTFVVDSIALQHIAPEFRLTGTSRPLPASIGPLDSLVFTLCCQGTRQDTVYVDTAILSVNCLRIPLPINLSVIEPRVNWLSPDQFDSLVCGTRDTVRVWLINDNLTGGQEIMRDVHIVGPDAAEFAIVGNQLGYDPLQYFPMDPGEKIWIDVAFKPDMSKPAPACWADRHATIVAANNLRNDPKIALTASILEPRLAVSAHDVDLGSTTIRIARSSSIDISNSGNASLTIASIRSSDTRLAFSGISQGDVLAPQEHRTLDIVMSSDTPDTIDASLTIETVEDCAGNDTVGVHLMIGDDPKRQTSVRVGSMTFPPSFTCERQRSEVVFENSGEADVELVAADIVGDPAGAFCFPDNTRHLALLKSLAHGETVSIPVVARPVASGTSQGILLITWDSLGTAVTCETPLSITATQSTSELAVTSTAIAPEPASKFTVAIVLRAAPAIAPTDLTFAVRYRGDLFSYRSIASAYGVRVLTSDFEPDGSQLITMTCTDPSAFRTGSELCRLTFEVMMSLEDSTAIELADPRFVQGSDSLCIETTLSPALLVRGDLCGDSLLRQVLLGRTELTIESLSPMPSRDRVRIVLRSAISQPAELVLLDALGRRVLERTSTLHAGPNPFDLDLTALPAGAYILQARGSGVVRSKTILHER